jgi:hypothetical protein
MTIIFLDRLPLGLAVLALASVVGAVALRRVLKA